VADRHRAGPSLPTQTSLPVSANVGHGAKDAPSYAGGTSDLSCEKQERIPVQIAEAHLPFSSNSVISGSGLPTQFFRPSDKWVKGKPHIGYVMIADLYGEINTGTSFSEDSVPGNVVLGLARGKQHIFRGIVDGLGTRKNY